MNPLDKAIADITAACAAGRMSDAKCKAACEAQHTLEGLDVIWCALRRRKLLTSERKSIILARMDAIQRGRG